VWKVVVVAGKPWPCRPEKKKGKRKRKKRKPG
jgi:hypothetical protein